jgi:predicted ATPase/signal transduction histidine kinase/tRNA A-37 threonylcarbamoyl transferase component Bud32
MTSPSPPFPYTIGETVYEGCGTAVYRATRNADGQPVVLKVLDPRNCRPKDLDRLKREYEMGKLLDVETVVRPLALETYEGRLALVMEDCGAEPLDRRLGAPMQIGRFLELAIRIAGAVADLHQQGVVHKDLKPANLLVHPTTGEVRIADLGLASRLPREPQAAQPARLVEGSLPYMSPEQTGRMNRGIDSRSDLYSLGVTFYQMLTGKLPLEARDPLEWIHCHVARAFAAPSEVAPEVPEAVERIVMKLLAKMPEERYQTAHGLRYDLERCFEPWSSRGCIEPFPSGERDVSDRLQIPQKLYGRDEEIAVLLRAFEHVVDTGAPELVLISGYSGIGKSTLVHELHKPVVRERGFFTSGKFDQYKRDIPYSTIVQAFQELVLELLVDSGELAAWKLRLLEALTVNGQLIVDLIPQVELIIGPQPPVPALPPAEVLSRFRLVLRQFIGVFAQKEHPLVLFLDDLQWADSASLGLLKELVTHSDMRFVLVVGAYRDNEVTPAHPLMLTLDEARREGAHLSSIVLGPLSHEHLTALISDALHCSGPEALPLADLVHQKTAGNPFFAIQFVTALCEERLIEFDGHTGTWRWDMAQIRAKGFTDNVVDLMIGKLKRLPARTQKALKQVACLGNTAELALLAMVHGGTEEEANADLWDAARAGLVLCSDGTCKFVHDRVQEAAYSLIPEESRAAVHLRIGRLLVSHLPQEAIAERVFDVANQLNRGVGLITDPQEKESLCRLNLLAGKKAKATAAYSSALGYLCAGQALLPSDSWASQYGLTYELLIERALCEWLCSHFDVAADLLATLMAHARSRVDQAAVYRIKVELHTTRGEIEQSCLTALACLELFGMDFPLHPTQEALQEAAERTWRELGERPIEDLAHLPIMVDPDMQSVVALLSASMPSAYPMDTNLHDVMCCEVVRLSLRYGNASGSPHGYVTFGAVLGRLFERWAEARRFGKVACYLAGKQGFAGGRAVAYYTAGVFIDYWVQRVGDVVRLMREAGWSAIESGHVNTACYASAAIVMCRLIQGDPLAEVAAEAEEQIEFVRRAKYSAVCEAIAGMRRIVQELRGQSLSLFSRDTLELDLVKFEAGLTNVWRPLNPGVYCVFKTALLFLYGNYEGAFAASSEARNSVTAGWPMMAECCCWTALTLAARYDQVTPEEQGEYSIALAAYQEQFRVWQSHCPENFFSLYALISAEIARIQGRELDAARLYEEAIRSARENGFVHKEGVAYELASRSYRARGFDQIADLYLREARSCYVRWGADGKVMQLERLYPQLRERRPLAPTATFAVRAEHLDLLSVVKASQTISGEILFDKLLRTLLSVVLEQGGAQKGCLLLVRGDDLAIEAEAAIEERQGTVTRVLHSLPVSSSALVPASILHYVRLTRERVILDDAAAKAGRFSGDEYIAQHKPRSVLCVPILRQAELIGLLYLENNLTTHAFTPERLLALELLATQAAISLENALLLARERESRAAAEAAERRTAFLAHELKTPLTGLHLKLDALARSIKQQETVSASWLSSSLTSSKRQLGRLSLLIDSLLDLSRVQMGRLVLTREPVDLVALVRDVAGRLSEQAELAGCELHVQATRAIWGQWDRLRLDQVATNLLTNALKYGGGKPVRIVADTDGAVARLSVSDQGIGISEADQLRVFEAFERATGLHQAQSLGLGLYLVRELVRAHGGRVHLHSLPGSGATFVIELPVEPGEREAGATAGLMDT